MTQYSDKVSSKWHHIINQLSSFSTKHSLIFSSTPPQARISLSFVSMIKGTIVIANGNCGNEHFLSPITSTEVLLIPPTIRIEVSSSENNPILEDKQQREGAMKSINVNTVIEQKECETKDAIFFFH